MWLDYQELDQLEDKAFDLDNLKGTVIFNSTPSTLACPHCRKLLNKFKYRLYDLELEFCDNKHGFRLDKSEEDIVLEIMKQTEKNLERKFQAEDEWAKMMRRMRSGSFFSKLLSLFR